jgi:hypothetical protein
MMDYQQQWQPRTDKLLDEAFGNYVEGKDTYLYFSSMTKSAA